MTITPVISPCARPQLQRKYRASRYFRQIFLQFINHLQRALRVGGFGKWVQFARPGMRATFSFRRSVLHRAGASGYIPGRSNSSM